MWVRALVVAVAFLSYQPIRASAQQYIFKAGGMQLILQSDGTATSLQDNGRELLGSSHLPFASITKSGHVVSATSIRRLGTFYHVVFGQSGISADLTITSLPTYIQVAVWAVNGSGVDALTLAQLSSPLTHSGGQMLTVLWDSESSLCLMGMSESVDTEISGVRLSATVYSKLGLQGQKVAIVAAQTPNFLDVAHQVEEDSRAFFPGSTVNGTWVKSSAAQVPSYLFADLTEANAQRVIEYAKLGGFRYILIYANVWSSVVGSYPINTVSFPHGQAGLQAVIAKCHAAGLGVGLHMITFSVAKNSSQVSPRPDPGLLKSGATNLSQAINAQIGGFTTTTTFAGTTQPSSADLVIDSEIVHCGQIEGTAFQQCTRGFDNTVVAAHKAGASVQWLTEADGGYLADPQSALGRSIADRTSSLLNSLNFDMVYLDGGDASPAGLPTWYWNGVFQYGVWTRIRHNLITQAAEITPWTWHIMTRGTCDDYAAVAVKEYLNDYKIAYVWNLYRNAFLPADLGWVALLSQASDHRATTPDELEAYAARGLALGSGMGLETTSSWLSGNGRSDEILKMLAAYEQLRLSGSVPASTREKLAQGEWHMTAPGEFHQVHYDEQRVALPATVTVPLPIAAPAQPFKFRLRVMPRLAAPGDRANIPLLSNSGFVAIQPPGAQAAMPGALVQRVDFSSLLNLTSHRALAVQIDVEGPASTGALPPVLNFQLEADGSAYRDYYLDLDFRGTRTVVLPAPGSKRMLAEFWPAWSNYSFKAALSSLNFSHIDALNIRWMRLPGSIQCKIKTVEALQEQPDSVSNLAITAGSSTLTIPGTMNTGDYAEFWADGPIRIFNQNGFLIRTAAADHEPTLNLGTNHLQIRASSGTVELTSISLEN